MASLSLGVGGPGGAIGVRGGPELETAVPKGRLSKLWYLVRMIYNNNFTRLKHTYIMHVPSVCFHQGLYRFPLPMLI